MFTALSLEEKMETAENIILNKFDKIQAEAQSSPTHEDLRETLLLNLDDLIPTIDYLKIPNLTKWIGALRREILTTLNSGCSLDCIKEQIKEYLTNITQLCTTYLNKNIHFNLNKNVEECKENIICPLPCKAVQAPNLDWLGDPSDEQPCQPLPNFANPVILEYR